MELAQQLASVPLLADLDDRVRRRLAEVGKRRTYDADDPIVKEGSTGTALYIVLSGKARVEREGQTIGELVARRLLRRARAHRGASADPRPWSPSTETDCLLFPAWEFTALLKEHPEIAVPIMRALIGRLHRREHHGA